MTAPGSSSDQVGGAATVVPAVDPVDDTTRAVALRLAASGHADASVQQRVVHAMLEAGASCRPADVIAALHDHVGPDTDTSIARLHTRLRALGGRLIIVGDRDYPPHLADAWPELGAPLWLFAAGAHVPGDRRPTVAVVGTRRPTADGLTTARGLSLALADAGVTVVSGMARGIDQAAHRGAVDGGGATVAVLGTGLGVDYPTGSSRLRAAVASSGALLTELPPGAAPRPWHFLARNRIISGLATATVVVEGRDRSGALQTARLAGGQGRDVWAVPGSINAPASAAPLALLRDGATPVTGIDDFVAAVCDTLPGPAAEVAPRGITGLSPSAAVVYDLIGAVPATTDALVSTSRLPAHAVLAAVAELVDRGAGVMTPHGIVRRQTATADAGGGRVASVSVAGSTGMRPPQW
ncbi:MAG: DNA-processing protein DprA [Actinobacteria bacterium]|nr:DNA-processing protein DprA [Actinomycetota bacterium]